jgi:hypothetical protein
MIEAERVAGQDTGIELGRVEAGMVEHVSQRAAGLRDCHSRRHLGGRDILRGQYHQEASAASSAA